MISHLSEATKEKIETAIDWATTLGVAIALGGILAGVSNVERLGEAILLASLIFWALVVLFPKTMRQIQKDKEATK